MPDPWMPGLRHDPGAGAGYPIGRNKMWMAVDHCTGGVNSYQVCKDGRVGYGTSLCQILLPKVGVPWQFCEIDSICYHAGNRTYGDYNPAGPGIEVERLWLPDEGRWEDLTDDQADWMGRIDRWLESEWWLPNVHYWGPQFPWWGANFHGHVNHAQIHPNDDGFTQEEWVRISLGAPVPEPLRRAPEMYLISDPKKKADKYVVGETGARHIKSVDEYNWLRGPLPFGGGLQEVPNISQGWFDSLPKVG